MKKTEQEIIKDNLSLHLLQLCKGEKLSGTPDAEQAVAYILHFLRENDVPYTTYTFPAYLSNPLDSHFLVFSSNEDCTLKDGIAIQSRPRSFSMNCPDSVTGELIFDPYVEEENRLDLKKDFLKHVKGKLVLGFGYDEKYAKLLEQHSALGWIQIWKSDEQEIHEDTVGTIWGTPDLESVWSTLHLPVAAINGVDGKALIHRLNQGEKLTASLQVTVDTHVENVILPVAHIKGTTDDFVLLSGHYDTWYVGAMDNGSSNSVMLELAKFFSEINRQTPMTRGLRIAWWPGHSNGRYMGSAWYADHFHQELKKHCIAHINSDLTGSLYANVLAVRSTGLEGKDFHHRAAALAGVNPPVIWEKIGRGADQSFWGERIPYHIAVRYERLPEEKESVAPGAGVWWWHTRYDTIDKVDTQVMYQEYVYLKELLHSFLTEPVLPADWSSYFQTIEQELTAIQQQGNVDLKEMITDFAAIKEHLTNLQSGRLSLKILKETAGRINQLRQSYGAEHAQDLAFAWGTFPLLSAGAWNLDNCPDDWQLFAQTTFIRQKNRIMDILAEMLEQLKFYREESE